jgi:hypothetical protein
MTKHEGAVMNSSRKFAVAVLAVAGLSGCASTGSMDAAQQDALRGDAAPAAVQQQVSRPAQSYGSMGGYRYRRLVAVNLRSS